MKKGEILSRSSSNLNTFLESKVQPPAMDKVILQFATIR